MEYILLLIGGIIAGTMGSVVGLGGGIVIVPLLLALGSISLLEVSPQMAVGTSMITVIFTGLASTITYMKLKRVDYKSSLYLFMGSGPGGIVGSLVNRYLNDDSFSVYFGIFIIFVAIILTLKNKQDSFVKFKTNSVQRTFTTTDGKVYTYGFNFKIAIPIAFIIGFVSGLFGIGGGSLLVPALILLFSFPSYIAIPTSMLIVLLSSIVSGITHISLGNVNWLFLLLLMPGAWFGGILGAKINNMLSSNMVVNILRLVLVIVGIRMILS